MSFVDDTFGFSESDHPNLGSPSLGPVLAGICTSANASGSSEKLRDTEKACAHISSSVCLLDGFEGRLLVPFTVSAPWMGSCLKGSVATPIRASVCLFSFSAQAACVSQVWEPAEAV